MKSPINTSFMTPLLACAGVWLSIFQIPVSQGQTFDSGQGYFLSSQVNPGSEGISVGDIDEDGNLDFVTADNGFLTLFLGDGAGGFPTVRTLATRPSNEIDSVVSDDNEDVILFETTGDGHLDILTPNILPNFTALTLFRSNPNSVGQFLSPSTRITNGVGTNPAAVSPLHLNPGVDAFVDLVLVTSNSPKVRTFIGNGEGGFSAGPGVNLSSSPSASGEGIATADINHDALMDVAVVDRQRVWILLNDGVGGFIRSSSATSSAIAGEHLEYDVALGDFNGDTHMDAVVANGGIFDNLVSTLHSVAVFFGDGTGGLNPTPASIDLGSEVADVETGDFDNDGNLDILAAVPDFFSTLGGAKIIRGHGDGTFDTENIVSLPAMGIASVCVETSDLDRDGRLDVIIGNEGLISGSGSDVPGTVGVYFSTLSDIGPATPTPTPTLVMSPTPTVQKSEDIDGDGFINSKDLIILLEQQGLQNPNP